MLFRSKFSKSALAEQLFTLAAEAHRQGWDAEELLAAEVKKREKAWRKFERQNTLRQL